MADDLSFYRARAAEERGRAADATLDNVRERCQRAETAWLAMAARAERTIRLRAEREADRHEEGHAPELEELEPVAQGEP